MYAYITSFVKRTDCFVSKCQLRDKLKDLIKSTSNFFSLCNQVLQSVLFIQINVRENI